MFVIQEDVLKGIDAVVYLAAISNDPIGNKYESVTLDINYRSAVLLALVGRSRCPIEFVLLPVAARHLRRFAEVEAMTERFPLNPSRRMQNPK